MSWWREIFFTPRRRVAKLIFYFHADSKDSKDLKECLDYGEGLSRIYFPSSRGVPVGWGV